MDVRKGEELRNWFRSDRYTCVNGQWYYQTREGSIEGPFGSMDEAGRDLLVYLRHAEDNLFMRLI